MSVDTEIGKKFSQAAAYVQGALTTGIKVVIQGFCRPYFWESFGDDYAKVVKKWDRTRLKACP